MFELMDRNFEKVHPDIAHTRFCIFKKDLPALRRIKKYQHKGTKEPPFDWADDIAKAFDKIICQVQKKGEAQVDCYW